jgi:hypothetical protein
MNFEAGATGRDIVEVQRAPLTRRLMMAPVGLVMAEAGAQMGVFVEDQLATFFPEKDKKGSRDKNWRAKVLLGKVFLAVLMYPVSAPLALGFAASGGLLHLLLGVGTFSERADQAARRQRQLLKLGELPRGRYTQKLKHSDKEDEKDDEDTDDEDSKPEGKDAPEERAEANETDVDLAAKLTDPDVLHIYGKAADQAWERLIQQGHLPPGTKPVINEAMVQEVQGLVRDAQKRGVM